MLRPDTSTQRQSIRSGTLTIRIYQTAAHSVDEGSRRYGESNIWKRIRLSPVKLVRTFATSARGAKARATV
eukprot:7047569-Pyramimonas_sp.AAC.1